MAARPYKISGLNLWSYVSTFPVSSVPLHPQPIFWWNETINYKL